MKVGNLVGGLEVIDVKRVNKLNLIQFLKEADSYLQQGYKLDVNSARQVGLVLSVDLFKTKPACSQKVGSVGDKVESKADEVVQEVQPLDTEAKEVTTNVETETEVSAPVKKPTTTRSKKTTQ